MKRKIFINDSESNRIITLDTDANTFGDVKRAAVEAGININGKDWLERTRIIFSSDDAVLPTNVPYKGGYTTDLVFMLTNTNKNIKSGADNYTRWDCYEIIREEKLKDFVREHTGRHYTNVPTVELNRLITLSRQQESTVETSVYTHTCCNENCHKYEQLMSAICSMYLVLSPEIQEDLKRNVIAQNITKEEVQQMFN